MGLWELPNEVFLIVLSFLDIEDQFNLGLTNSNFFSFICRSDAICKYTLKEKAPSAKEYLEARKTGAYAMAWRRFAKRRIALRTATPFHFSIVGVGLQFILSNDVLVYKTTQDEIRMLFLDGQTDEEIRIDPRRLVVEAFPSPDLAQSDTTVDPMYYSDGVASFFCESDDLQLIIFCHVWHRTILKTYQPECSNSIFIRNNDRYLYCGYRKQFPGAHWAWVINGFDFTNETWSTGHRLPQYFAGTELGQSVCFEIIDGFLYGVSTAHFATPVPGQNSYYRVFRMLIGSKDAPQFLPKLFSWRRHWQAGSIDTRFSDLKLVKDEETAVLAIYETRKEWTLKGHSERNCYRKEIRFDTSWDSYPVVQEHPWSGIDELSYNGPHGEESRHLGDSGLNHTESDPLRLQAFSYNTTVRTFLDILRVSPPDGARNKLRLRARAMVPYVDDAVPGLLWRGDTDADNPYLHYWPPAPKRGSDRTQFELIRALMNPKQGVVEKVLWASNDRFFIFSPVVKGTSTQPSAIILLSFDPGFKFYGLERVNSTLRRDIPLPLMQLPSRGDPDDTHWVHRVRPFHLVIKPPKGQHYGFDFTYEQIIPSSMV